MKHSFRLPAALCLLSSVLWLTALAQAPKDTTVAPPPEPPKPAAEVINPALPTLWVASDSTAANGGLNATGWGVPLPSYFDLAKINVANRARGGRSSRTFITEGLWDKLLEGVKAGDFVLIQFGHNDAGVINEDASVPRECWRSRGVIRSLGEETEEIQNILTKQPETVHTYGWYLRKYIRDAKAAGATPIVCSLVPRKTWQEGKISRQTDTYAGWARQVAAGEGVACIDLNDLVATRYEALGAEKVEPLFADPHTHTSKTGADLNAEILVEALKTLPGAPLAPFLIRAK